ncbi:universal stress protein [Timonella senegalensis]|uniref:universal stress protein n=1 Tax=Timonella senegalensis TaxID=1465825 RepID=UPI0002FB23D6|nr:universal stress protein [Timonella senegalensis]
MTEQHSILVGVDGSLASLHALDWAIALAKRNESRITLACSYSLPTFAAASLDGGYAALDDSTIQEGARLVLENAAARVKEAGVPVNAQIASGDPAGALVELSKDHHLAVVGTRGRSGFTERLLGTVSSALPAHAKCPVVVVPGRGLKDNQPLPEIKPVGRVIVGVDGSSSAQGALHTAVRYAQIWGAEIVAVAGVPVTSGSGVLSWLPSTIDHEQVLKDVAIGLDMIIDAVEEENPGLKIRRMVLDGTGAELLTEFSQAADLLVVGSRGRGGFAGLLLGSTSQAVLHHSKCPVLVVNKKCEGGRDFIREAADGEYGDKGSAPKSNDK